MRDAHKILSVSRNASMSDIKLAYRRLALQLHPDTNGGDAAKAEQFKRVNQAYTYLTDPKSKLDDFDSDFDHYSTYKNYSNYSHTSRAHWNPFQSPFENMKNAQKWKGKNRNSPGDFEEWDDFGFFDFETGEEIIFGFDKKGKAKMSRKKSPFRASRNRKPNQKNSQGPSSKNFTTEDIEDIIRNSAWESDESSGDVKQNRSGNGSRNRNAHKRNNRNTRKGSAASKGDINSNNNNNNNNNRNRKKKSRRRRGGDDCAIS